MFGLMVKDSAIDYFAFSFRQRSLLGDKRGSKFKATQQFFSDGHYWSSIFHFWICYLA